MSTTNQQLNLPLNLINYMANAFNAKEGDFLSKPIFKLTNQEKKTIDWNGEKKDIPDQISAENSSYSIQQNKSTLLRNIADYDEVFSRSIDAEWSGVSFKGSASSEFMYHGSLFSDSSSFYGLNTYLQTIMNFERLSFLKKDLENEFIEKLLSLPLEAKEKESLVTFKKLNRHFDA